jgi:hypothetical protein
MRNRSEWGNSKNKKLIKHENPGDSALVPGAGTGHVAVLRAPCQPTE